MAPRLSKFKGILAFLGKVRLGKVLFSYNYKYCQIAQTFSHAGTTKTKLVNFIISLLNSLNNSLKTTEISEIGELNSLISLISVSFLQGITPLFFLCLFSLKSMCVNKQNTD